MVVKESVDTHFETRIMDFILFKLVQELRKCPGSLNFYI